MKGLETDNEEIRPIITISEAPCFKDETEDDVISTFISGSSSVSYSTCLLLQSVMSCNVQEPIELAPIVEDTHIILPRDSVPIQIEPGKILDVNPNLSLA